MEVLLNMKTNTQKLAFAAVVGAAYAALTLLLAPISFGLVQFRVSEALCILPAFVPSAAWGLWVGCALSNLLGGYGLIDIVFGSLATLLASLCIVAIAKGDRLSWLRCILVVLMPVVWNGPIIGAIIAFSSGAPFGSGWLIFMAQIAVEEAGVMFALGLPLMRILPRSKRLMELMSCPEKTLS